MEYADEIRKLCQRIDRCERKVEALRRRIASLDGNDVAHSIAKELSAATEETLRIYRTRLEAFERAAEQERIDDA